MIGSPGYPRDEDWLRDVARRCHGRAHDPAGIRRQLAAIVAAEDRRPMLRTLRLPALVIGVSTPTAGRASAETGDPGSAGGSRATVAARRTA